MIDVGSNYNTYETKPEFFLIENWIFKYALDMIMVDFFNVVDFFGGIN